VLDDFFTKVVKKTWFAALSLHYFKRLVQGISFIVYGLWFIVYGLSFMVCGFSFMVYGFSFMVYGRKS